MRSPVGSRRDAGTEGIWNKNRVERVYVLKAPLEATKFRRPNRRSGNTTLAFRDRRYEGMRPVCWSSQFADDGTAPLADVDAQSSEIPAAAVPAECPGVFMEQPLERWSPRDLIVGVLRLVRWTRLATS